MNNTDIIKYIDNKLESLGFDVDEMYENSSIDQTQGSKPFNEIIQEIGKYDIVVGINFKELTPEIIFNKHGKYKNLQLNEKLYLLVSMFTSFVNISLFKNSMVYEFLDFLIAKMPLEDL